VSVLLPLPVLPTALDMSAECKENHLGKRTNPNTFAGRDGEGHAVKNLWAVLFNMSIPLG
jgi:hypothetical protein